jgi:hypothetical protein
VVNPPFARLAELGPDGKVKKIDGILDIMAIPRNPTVDDATRERIRPLVKNWLADVDQLAIDNLDFIEKIEPPAGGPGVIENVKVEDMKSLQYAAQMMTQLMSAGPLSSYLEQKEGFTKEQGQMNQQITSDYLQQQMNEIMAKYGGNNTTAQAGLTAEQKAAQVNEISRFLYYISCRDAMACYHRMLEQGAPLMDQAIQSLRLTPEQQSSLKKPLADCKAAGSAEAKRRAARDVLDQLTFDQRREALARARDLAPPYDPISELGPPIPPPPNAGQPVAAQPQAPAPAPAYTPQPTDASKDGGR